MSCGEQRQRGCFTISERPHLQCDLLYLVCITLNTYVLTNEKDKRYSRSMNRTEQLQIRVTHKEKAALKRFAQRAGQGVSAYVLSRALPENQLRYAELLRALQDEGERRFALAELNDLLVNLTRSECRDSRRRAAGWRAVPLSAELRGSDGGASSAAKGNFATGLGRRRRASPGASFRSTPPRAFVHTCCGPLRCRSGSETYSSIQGSAIASNQDVYDAAHQIGHHPVVRIAQFRAREGRSSLANSTSSAVRSCV